jgi:hypothetical protein
MAFTVGNTILPGYVMPLTHSKYIIHFDHTGPASYTQVVTGGVTPTGGDRINASDLGMGGFDNADVMLDTTGQFYALIIPVGGGNGNAVPYIILRWFSAVTATVGGQAQTNGAEVVAGTNLSTFSLRVEGIMV